MISFLYSTFGTQKDAKKIARQLLEERLVACVNIIPNISSVYRWKGRIEEAEECVLIAKTIDKNIDRVIQKIKSLHPYEVPAIVVLPIIAGLQEYIDYVKDELK
ncbi:MAG: divalent-cation tolerance protein CutA [Candidatus Thermoplasmatota archaeon]